MPRGDKSSYTDKQKRMAAHIEEGYRKSGKSEKEAERRAWATVNKTTGGGKKHGGSGHGREENHEPAQRGGRISGQSQSHATRVRAGRKAAATRRRKATQRSGR